MDKIVTVNVGGIIYTTTIASLTKYPDSMLGTMFNGRMESAKDPNGYVFIDRDGEIFRIILNFLRSNRLCLPKAFSDFDLLISEADFYQITPLIDAALAVKKRFDLESGEGTNGGRFVEITEVRVGSSHFMPAKAYDRKMTVRGHKKVLFGLPMAREDYKPLLLLMNKEDTDYVEIEIGDNNARILLREHLLSKGWKLIDSALSSSSGYDSKSLTGTLIVEHTYRDTWFLPNGLLEPETNDPLLPLSSQSNGIKAPSAISGEP